MIPTWRGSTRAHTPIPAAPPRSPPPSPISASRPRRRERRRDAAADGGLHSARAAGGARHLRGTRGHRLQRAQPSIGDAPPHGGQGGASHRAADDLRHARTRHRARRGARRARRIRRRRARHERRRYRHRIAQSHPQRLAQSARSAAQPPAARRLPRRSKTAAAAELDRARSRPQQRTLFRRAARRRQCGRAALPRCRPPVAGLLARARPSDGAAARGGGDDRRGWLGPHQQIVPSAGRVRAPIKNVRYCTATNSGERGVALITAVLITAVIAVAAVAMAAQQKLDVRRTANMIDGERAYVFALGVESWVQQVLARDRRDNQTDHLGEAWAKQLPAITVEGAVLAGRLEDLQGRFNLNNLVDKDKVSAVDVARFQRLLTSLAIDPNISNAVVDWIDPDADTTYPDGAEDAEYLRATPPYRAANRPMASASELLLVRGVTSEIYLKLAPVVAALPGRTAINVNTAPKAVF